MNYENITIKGDGVTLALLIWRRFHAPMPGLAEQALAINHGLADLGPILPVGTAVVLPIPDTSEKVREMEVIRLF